MHRAVKGVLLLSALTVSAAPYAESDADTLSVKHSYHIGGGSLSHVLSQFATASGLLFVAEARLTEGKTSAGLDGEYTVDEGFRKLLAGTGLNYTVTSDKTVTLKVVQRQSQFDSTTMPAVEVTGRVVYDANDPYNPNYSRANASTGTRTDTPLMETPISIQVVPRAVLQDQQSIQVGDAIKNVSGVFQGNTFGGFAEQFLIRGFNTSFNNYQDGFRWPASRLTMANVERVEVVKGAAANLYGRIEPGGMINVVTKRPQAAPYYALEQQFGSYDLYRTTADATGAINADGSLMYRLNVESLNKNSFRDFAFTDRVFVAPSLTWKISDRTQLDLDFMYSDEDTQEDYGVVASTLTRRPVNIPISRYLNEPSTDKSNTTLYNTAVTLSHAFNDDWKVKARFNYLNRNTVDPQTSGVFWDEDPSSATYGDMTRDFYGSWAESETYYGNVNLTGRFNTFGVEHQTLIGWEHYSGTSTLKTQYDPIDWGGATINIFHPVYRPTDPSNMPYFYQNGSGSNSNGVYFQDQITLFDKLHILGGGRYDWISDVGSGFAEVSAEAALANRKTTNNEGFSPRVGLLYQPWQWLSVYGNYVESMGSANGAIDAHGKLLDPQIGEQYEAGFKTSFFDQRLTSNVAFYHLSKKNMAVSVPGKPYSEAIGEARSQGVEIDVSGQVTDGLSLIGSYAYTDAVILKADNNQGNKLWNVPRNAGSLWAKYDIQQAELRGLSVGAGAYFQDTKQGNNANEYQLPGWGRIDALIKYQLPVAKTRTTLQFNIENLLDHQYYIASSPGLTTFVIPGQPRTFMGSVKIEF
ncbi:TonB-dependent receptor [Methylomonas koyamae]|uniref:TonB-dependent receptor n=1 Tax=Methylomonas koyamae TaxID=702114 RepID=A0A177N240_9GAMM|nr:TonB-dependent receptor [Methylomonas koyamae]